jgi:pSer/pThr/pTyr-binding forkhead associated (FHA) protein
VLESITVSRQHVLLMRDATGVRLLDLESTNGTLVNGVPAPPDAPVRLADGDVVRLGQVVARYIYRGTARERQTARALGAGARAAK